MIHLVTDNILQYVKTTLCLTLILSLIGISVWNFCLTIRQGITYIKKLHDIPCSGCAFFTGDYRLKCTVHPDKALTETALNCRDYESINNLHRPSFQKCQSNSNPLPTQEVNYRIYN